ncbi:MAG: hypothetical protein COU71_00235 [Parcubacteria group bacterium CG10_big_fil_rev_8_21_14_0_10_38_31]|nr:MAG: hypothetical protein COU71_00235 [Parcubacteria group bacterium CG10_big_fil_rev_8_21_14_0_10_38_31]
MKKIIMLIVLLSVLSVPVYSSVLRNYPDKVYTENLLNAETYKMEALEQWDKLRSNTTIVLKYEVKIKETLAIANEVAKNSCSNYTEKDRIMFNDAFKIIDKTIRVLETIIKKLDSMAGKSSLFKGDFNHIIFIHSMHELNEWAHLDNLSKKEFIERSRFRLKEAREIAIGLYKCGGF